jgi:hypothetical protein
MVMGCASDIGLWLTVFVWAPRAWSKSLIAGLNFPEGRVVVVDDDDVDDGDGGSGGARNNE